MKWISNKGKLYNNCYLAVPSEYDKDFQEVVYDIYAISNYKRTPWMEGVLKGSVELALKGSGRGVIWLS